MGATTEASGGTHERVRFLVDGAVQGVGFRPFVYRLARGLDLAGWVANSTRGVTIEVEGPPARLKDFGRRLRGETPPLAVIQGLETRGLPPRGTSGFQIRKSEAQGEHTAVVLPDAATCPHCLGEVRDPDDRRYRYPFTNCTDCGPRYTIIRDMPYDRARTTMMPFTMCRACRQEYERPGDRRFHAEPNACPACGPQLTLTDGLGRVLERRDDAMRAAGRALRAGRIVAVKGVGGFHLLVDARDDAAVRRLRARKHREAKALAVMAPSLAAAEAMARLSPLERDLITSPAAPIVLLEKRTGGISVATSVAPDNPDLGVLLPYTPLHHLLLADLAFPVVATSGNLSDEPLCFQDDDALERLCNVADLFLIHDREIVRPVDDSVVRVVAGRELVLRRARGYAPFPVAAADALPPLLAVGGHMKSTVAVSTGRHIVVSPHIGDLDGEAARHAHAATADALCLLYRVEPSAVATDLHPDYASSSYARAAGPPIVAIQHHYAHVLACMADNELAPPALGFAWDGTGLGTDGTIWGGETLLVSQSGFTRRAWLRPFPLPGGDRAAREPRRSALGALYEIDPAAAEASSFFRPAERAVLLAAMRGEIQSPRTSSAGRLFDAVAALVGLGSFSRFEGEAAMALEFALRGLAGDGRYEFDIAPDADGGWVVDWRPALEGVRADVAAGVARGSISLRFHNTLAEIIVAVAHRCGIADIALSGGCFQNKYLTERAVARAREEGFSPHWHRRIPPGDGGLAVGQILGAARALAAGS